MHSPLGPNLKGTKGSSFKIRDKAGLNFVVSWLFCCGFFEYRMIDLNERIHVHRRKPYEIGSLC